MGDWAYGYFHNPPDGGLGKKSKEDLRLGALSRHRRAPTCGCRTASRFPRARRTVTGPLAWLKVAAARRGRTPSTRRRARSPPATTPIRSCTARTSSGRSRSGGRTRSPDPSPTESWRTSRGPRRSAKSWMSSSRTAISRGSSRNSRRPPTRTPWRRCRRARRRGGTTQTGTRQTGTIRSPAPPPGGSRSEVGHGCQRCLRREVRPGPGGVRAELQRARGGRCLRRRHARRRAGGRPVGRRRRPRDGEGPLGAGHDRGRQLSSTTRARPRSASTCCPSWGNWTSTPRSPATGRSSPIPARRMPFGFVMNRGNRSVAITNAQPLIDAGHTALGYTSDRYGFWA